MTDNVSLQPNVVAKSDYFLWFEALYEKYVTHILLKSGSLLVAPKAERVINECDPFYIDCVKNPGNATLDISENISEIYLYPCLLQTVLNLKQKADKNAKYWLYFALTCLGVAIAFVIAGAVCAAAWETIALAVLIAIIIVGGFFGVLRCTENQSYEVVMPFFTKVEHFFSPRNRVGSTDLKRFDQRFHTTFATANGYQNKNWLGEIKNFSYKITHEDISEKEEKDLTDLTETDILSCIKNKEKNHLLVSRIRTACIMVLLNEEKTQALALNKLFMMLQYHAAYEIYFRVITHAIERLFSESGEQSADANLVSVITSYLEPSL